MQLHQISKEFILLHFICSNDSFHPIRIRCIACGIREIWSFMCIHGTILICRRREGEANEKVVAYFRAPRIVHRTCRRIEGFNVGVDGIGVSLSVIKKLGLFASSASHQRKITVKIHLVSAAGVAFENRENKYV